MSHICGKYINSFNNLSSGTLFILTLNAIYGFLQMMCRYSENAMYNDLFTSLVIKQKNVYITKNNIYNTISLMKMMIQITKCMVTIVVTYSTDNKIGFIQNPSRIYTCHRNFVLNCLSVIHL